MSVRKSIDAILIGDSLPMQRLRMLVAAVAPTRVPVLIEGATGTGKELVAGLLHQESRRDGAFVAFNVCALGDSMFEDALFGHVKGAFTGAAGETLGFLREANGGTAFLDEISGLALPLQAKLLRAIETGVVRPVGSSRDARSDFRTVAATNEKIDELVEKGMFRADLAHRLSGMILTVPTLAERVDDIPVLVEHFVRTAHPNRSISVTRSAMHILRARPWLGNVRELKQVVEAALVFTRDVLDDDALAVVLAQRSRRTESPSETPAFVERQRLVTLLNSASWDTELAASTLGVHRTTIYRRMRRLGIPVPSSGDHRHLEGPSVSPSPPTIGRFAGVSSDLQRGHANTANVLM
jgi:two-component system nitrogen regulation response regulator NtrX